jgi:hypothetical protein
LKYLFKLFAFCSLLFIFTGCGYKPMSEFATKIRGKVYVDISVNVNDPKNSVLIKDAMHEILVSRFKSTITKESSLADTNIRLTLNSATLTAIEYDKQGYVRLYRQTVSISAKYHGEFGNGSTKVSGNYDFSVDNDSTISDTKRFEAIKIASLKALEDILSKLAIESFKK